MEQEILKAGLLGTDKYTLPIIEPVREIQEKIIAKSTGNEDCFLKTTAASLYFREAAQTSAIIDLQIPVCPSEKNEYIDENFAFLIRSALFNKEEVLLSYLLFICRKKGKIVPSELVPALLNKALSQKEHREELLACCGETGKWLCSLRKEWKEHFFGTESNDVWETGSLENRKNYLLSLRKHEPQKALGLLEQCINEENAATRQVFIEILKEGLSLHDIPFLESLLSDKSQKVKDLALGYLCRIQGSSINEMYLRFILQTINVKQERYLLVGKKNVLQIDENNIPSEEIFKTGIDKLSPDKNLKDYIFILGQLLENVDPAIIAQGLNISDEELIKLFLQHSEADTLTLYLNNAAVLFHNRAWSLALLQARKGITPDLLNVLSPEEQNVYYDLFLKTSLPSLLTYLLDENYSLLPVDIIEKILVALSQNPYQVDANRYQRIALHSPDTIIPLLKKRLEDNIEDYKVKYFKNQVTEMLRIMELRKIIE